MAYRRASANSDVVVKKKTDNPPMTQGEHYQKLNTPIINVDLSTLPSKGLLYPEDATIDIRPYSFGDMKRLNGGHYNELEKLIGFVLSGVMPSFEAEDLLLIDFMYIALLRKLSSNTGTEYQCEYECNQCGESNIYRFKMTDIDTYDLGEGFPKTIPHSSGFDLVFHPATIKNYRYLAKNKQLENEVAFTAVQVANFSFKEAYEIVDNSYLEDMEKLEEIDRDIAVGVKPNESSCGKCGHKNLIGLERWDRMISPFRSDKSE